MCIRDRSKKHKNICCVGDDDQSIYSWRGAEISNILRFEKDFPNAKVIRLEENYRSTGHILTAASKLIENNESRLGKTLWTNSGQGEKIVIKSVWDGEEEARQITSELEKLSLKNYNLDETAILVRASFQMREFEDRFISVGLPYKVIGGPRFYERKEIRDVNAYLRIALQPKDSLALERIINTPKRGIGETTLKKIRDRSKQNNLPMIDSIKELMDEKAFKGKADISLKKLIGLIIGIFSLSAISGASATELKLATFEPPKAFIASKILAAWATKVNQCSAGSLNVKMYAGGVLGSPPKQYDIVTSGVADISWTVLGYIGGQFPLSSVIELPFLTRTSKAGTTALNTLFNEGYLDKEMAGIKAVSYTHLTLPTICSV